MATALVALIVAGGSAAADAASRSSSVSVVVPGLTMLAAVADPLPEPQQDPATSRAQANEILGRSEFRAPEPSVIDRARTWLSEALGRLLTSLFAGGVGSALAWGILAVVVAGVIFLVTRVLRTVQHEPMRPGPTGPVEVRRSPVEWRHEAEACEARGEWKDALRCRFRALVGDLVARRVVRDLPGRTSGEYRADVAATLPAAAADFAAATELFEQAWYGDVSTGPDESARFQHLAALVVDRAGKPTKAAEVILDLDPVSA